MKALLILAVLGLVVGSWLLSAALIQGAWNFALVAAVPSVRPISYSVAMLVMLALMIVGSFFRSTSK